MRKRLATFWQFALLGNLKEVVEKCTMKIMLGSSYLAIMVFTLGCLSQYLLNPVVQENEDSLAGAAHIYGPVPMKLLNQNHYHFDQVAMDFGGAFGGLEIDRLYEMSKEQVRELMLRPIPVPLHERFLMVLPIALSFAEQYQVDPFWVVSVMWVESHFDPLAQSKVRAKGLMQVLTPTGVGIARRLGRNVSKVHLKKMIHDPVVNIELGTVYLRHLLEQFEGNYVLASVAYNMGPSRVRKRLRENLPVGENNYYLKKVKRAYRSLSKSFVDQWRQKNRPYENTMIVDLRYTPQTVTERWIYSLWEEITTPRVALN